MRKLGTILLSTISLLVLISCGSIPYRIDINQGNSLEKKDISKLQIGMSKEDVQNIIGTPLLNDLFNKNRWDYIHYYKNRKGDKKKISKLSLFFINGLLSQIKSDDVKEIKTESVPYGDLK